MLPESLDFFSDKEKKIILDELDNLEITADDFLDKYGEGLSASTSLQLFGKLKAKQTARKMNFKEFSQ